MNNLQLRLGKSIFFLAYLVVSTVVLLVLLEVGARFVKTKGIYNTPVFQRWEEMSAYSYYDWKEDYFKDLTAWYTTGKDRLVYEPYSLWKHQPFQSKNINVMDNGYRKTINPVKENPHQTLNVFIFGGSTTWCLEVPDPYTYSSLVSAKLNEKYPDSQINVRNYSAGGFLQDQEIVLLSRLLQHDKPDLVIFYDGVNDVSNKVAFGWPHSHYPMYSNFSTGTTYKDVLIYMLRTIHARSRLVQLLIPDSRKSEHPFITDPDTLDQNSEELYENWKSNYLYLDKLSTKFGFNYMVILQPNLYSTQKVLHPEEEIIKNLPAIKASEASIRVSYPKLQRLAKDRMHPNFYDFTSVLDEVEEHVFLDRCHVTAIANDKIAEGIVKMIYEKKLLPATQHQNNENKESEPR